jgi:glycosyltransferase involved in cell wall biosynthesis
LVRTSSKRWDTVVISLGDEGYYGESLRSLGVTVLCCRMRPPHQLVAGFIRLLRFLRRSRPQVVQTWMYHADLLGGVAARLTGCRTVLWGVRNLRFVSGTAGWSARGASRLCAWLSRKVPVAIISCSTQAAREHERRGYANDKLVVIPNGYDCAQLRVDKAAGQRIRSEWGVSAGEFLVGMVARWDPLKDHGTLFAALQPLMRAKGTVRCALIGQGMTADNGRLSELLRRHDLGAKVVLAGPRDDITEVMNALDLHVLPSRSEAFPNVVAEAMACGTPCIVSAVGDAPRIVGDKGWCVSPGDAAALCQAMRTAMELLASAAGDDLRSACRQRIATEFSQESMAAAFEDTWLRAMTGGTAGVAASAARLSE